MADKPVVSETKLSSTAFDSLRAPKHSSTSSSSLSIAHSIPSFTPSSTFHPINFLQQSSQYSPIAKLTPVTYSMSRGQAFATSSHSPATTSMDTTNKSNSKISADQSIKLQKMDIHSLMSPPDHVFDSFHSSSTTSHKMKKTPEVRPVRRGSQDVITLKQPLPMSPPISPFNKSDSSTNFGPAISNHHQVKDPVLYPSVDDASVSSPPQPPLFAVAEYEDHQRIVDDHLRARSAASSDGHTWPRREDYELALLFRSQVLKHYSMSPKAWLRQERAFLQADRQAGAHRYHHIMPAKPVPSRVSKSQRTDRISKPSATGRTARNSHTGQPSPLRASRPAAAPRVGYTPEPSKRVVAPNREDKDFASLPDYCPPINTLPHRPNSLKVEWKGQPIDLSHDPHAHLLHPDEVLLAGNLRLDCATYLTSKRRVFERRLQCLRTGKEFRKTDAQQACKIDVNKASKLWTAFDKVGWLDGHWVRKYL